MNITVIDSLGSPTTTQTYEGSQAAIDIIRDYVRRGQKGDRFYTPVIAAYLFDHDTKKLRRFEVRDGKLHELI